MYISFRFFFVVLSFGLLFFSQIAYANDPFVYKIYFINNTDQQLQVVSNCNPPGSKNKLSKSICQDGTYILEKYQPKQVMSINYNRGIKNKAKYYPQLTVTDSSRSKEESLIFKTYIQGKLVGSSVKALYFQQGETGTPANLMSNIKPPEDRSIELDNWWGQQKPFIIYAAVNKDEGSPQGAKYITYVINEPEQQLSYQKDKPHVLTLLTYNVQLFPASFKVAVPLNNPSQRVQEIPKHVAQYDVVAFNELWAGEVLHDGYVDEMLTGMLNQGYLFTCHPLHGKLTDKKFLGDGVVVFSRWRIERCDYKIYSDNTTSGDDALAAKGVVYVRLDKLGKKYNIFATHLQASGAQSLREAQGQELATFIKTQNISSNEPVIVMGDLNTNCLSSADPNSCVTNPSQNFVNLKNILNAQYLAIPLN